MTESWLAQWKTDLSDPSPVSNGVKQGYLLAPTLFTLIFATMLFSALSATYTGINVRCRCDVLFFNLRCLKVKSKVVEALTLEPDLGELASCG